MQLPHTISFNFDSELNKEVENEPIVFGSYHNIIKATWHTETSNTIIFEDSIVGGAVYIGTVMCHIKTSIFDHFIVKFGYRENRFVLVKNENVTIGPAVPAVSRYESSLHSDTNPYYVGYRQTSSIPTENIPEALIKISQSESGSTLCNTTNCHSCNRVGKVIGSLFYKAERYLVVVLDYMTTEFVLERNVIKLSDELTQSLRSKNYYYKGHQCDIISTYMLGANVWHNIRCASINVVGFAVSAGHVFYSNVNSSLLYILSTDDTWVIDDLVNFDHHLSQYKGE